MSRANPESQARVTGMSEPRTEAGRRLLAGHGHVKSYDGPPAEEAPWCAADDEEWPCPLVRNIIAIEAEAAAASELNIVALGDALYAALGWSTARYRPDRAHDHDDYATYDPIPQGIVSGDRDHPDWAALTARVAMCYRAALLASRLDADKEGEG